MIETDPRKRLLRALLRRRVSDAHASQGCKSDVHLLDALTLPPETSEEVGAPDLLVTGATGYVGAFLVGELLRRPGGKIRCLVRADSTSEAHQRVLGTLRKFRIAVDPAAARSRLVAVPGDLGTPGLGLDEATSDALAREVTAVFHVGAWVNFVMPYAELRASNVLGTADLLRLATRTRRIPFHFVSSSSVFASPELAGREMAETEVLAVPTMLPNGYAQSKWAAEGLVRAAADKGLRATIFRPAFVGFDSSTGVHNPSDVPSLLFSAMAKLDIAPDVEFALDLVHVDAVVRDLVDLASKPGAQGTFHLSHPAPLPRFSSVRAALVRSDPRLTVVSLPEFIRRLATLPAGAPERALLQMLGTEGRWSVLDSLAVDAVPILGRAQTDAALGAPAPHLSDDAVLRYWQRLRDPS